MVGRPGHRDVPSFGSPRLAATGSLPAARVVARRCRRAQADSFARPLRRRSLMIARPARVRIRSRNPCFRDRRRLFGWNVRFTFKLQGIWGYQSWTDDHPPRSPDHNELVFTRDVPSRARDILGLAGPIHGTRTTPAWSNWPPGELPASTLHCGTKPRDRWARHADRANRKLPPPVDAWPRTC